MFCLGRENETNERGEGAGNFRPRGERRERESVLDAKLVGEALG